MSNYTLRKYARAIRKIARHLRLASSPLSKNPNISIFKYSPDGNPFILTVLDKTGEEDLKEAVTLKVDPKRVRESKGMEKFLSFSSTIDKLMYRWSQSESMTFDDAFSDLQKVVGKLFGNEDREYVYLKKEKIHAPTSVSKAFKISSPTVNIRVGDTSIEAKFGNEYLIRGTYEKFSNAGGHVTLRTDKSYEILAKKAEHIINLFKEKEQILKNILPEKFVKILEKLSIPYIVCSLKDRKCFKMNQNIWEENKTREERIAEKNRKDREKWEEFQRKQTEGGTGNTPSEPPEDRTVNVVTPKKNPPREDITRNVPLDRTRPVVN